jgi:hypothetical protein
MSERLSDVRNVAILKGSILNMLVYVSYHWYVNAEVATFIL